MSHRNAFRRITGQQSNLGGKGIDLGVAIIRASKLTDHRSQSWRGDLRCKTTSLQVAEKSQCVCSAGEEDGHGEGIGLAGVSSGNRR
jgi:hypothetical protein